MSRTLKKSPLNPGGPRVQDRFCFRAERCLPMTEGGGAWWEPCSSSRGEKRMVMRRINRQRRRVDARAVAEGLADYYDE